MTRALEHAAQLDSERNEMFRPGDPVSSGMARDPSFSLRPVTKRKRSQPDITPGGENGNEADRSAPLVVKSAGRSIPVALETTDSDSTTVNTDPLLKARHTEKWLLYQLHLGRRTDSFTMTRVCNFPGRIVTSPKHFPHWECKSGSAHPPILVDVRRIVAVG